MGPTRCAALTTRTCALGSVSRARATHGAAKSRASLSHGTPAPGTQKRRLPGPRRRPRPLPGRHSHRPRHLPALASMAFVECPTWSGDRRCRDSTECSNDVEPPAHPFSRGCDVLTSPRPPGPLTARGEQAPWRQQPSGTPPHPDTTSEEQHPIAAPSNRRPTARHVSRETDTEGEASTDGAIERAGPKAVGPGVPLNSTTRVRRAAPRNAPQRHVHRKCSPVASPHGREAASARSVIDHVCWSPEKAPAHGRPPGRTLVPLDTTGTNSCETLAAIARPQLLGPHRPVLRRDGVPPAHPAAGDMPFRTPLRPPYAPDGVRIA